jgi:NIPSNAP
MARSRLLVLVSAFCFGLALPSLAAADSNTVLQVTAVQVKPGQMDAYLAKVKQLQAIIKRLGTPGTTRVWEATLAGDDSGTVVVGVEYPSLAAYAESTSKVSADPEWQKMMAGLDDMRTVVSRSLYRERTP